MFDTAMYCFLTLLLAEPSKIGFIWISLVEVGKIFMGTGVY